MTIADLFSGPRLSQIISSINNFQVYLEPGSPLITNLLKHIEKHHCDRCLRFLDYHGKTFINHHGERQLNNYRKKPSYPCCPIGIKIFKKFFSSMLNFNENLLVTRSEHSDNQTLVLMEPSSIPTLSLQDIAAKRHAQ